MAGTAEPLRLPPPLPLITREGLRRAPPAVLMLAAPGLGVDVNPPVIRAADPPVSRAAPTPHVPRTEPPLMVKPGAILALCVPFRALGLTPPLDIAGADLPPPLLPISACPIAALPPPTPGRPNDPLNVTDWPNVDIPTPLLGSGLDRATAMLTLEPGVPTDRLNPLLVAVQRASEIVTTPAAPALAAARPPLHLPARRSPPPSRLRVSPRAANPGASRAYGLVAPCPRTPWVDQVVVRVLAPHPASAQPLRKPSVDRSPWPPRSQGGRAPPREFTPHAPRPARCSRGRTAGPSPRGSPPQTGRPPPPPRSTPQVNSSPRGWAGGSRCSWWPSRGGVAGLGLAPRARPTISYDC